MARSARKEREIKEREELILDVARRILVEEGFPALSMDRIASEIEYSKGTVYQHFQSKEDVMAGLAVSTHRRRTEFFERAATFQGRPRERIMAIGIAADLFIQLYPSHFRAEQISLLTGDLDKLEGQRLRQCYDHENRCFEICCGIIRDAVASGDLTLTPPNDVETLTFGLWSMSFGSHFLGHTMGRFQNHVAAHDLYVALYLNFAAMLDGIGFAPLSTEWDYESTAARIQTQVFGEEMKALQGS